MSWPAIDVRPRRFTLRNAVAVLSALGIFLAALAGWQAIRDYSFDRQGQAIVARADSMASRLGQVHADDSRLRSTLDSAIREIRTLRESAGAAGSDGEQLDLLEARLDSIQRRVAPFLDQGPPPP